MLFDMPSRELERQVHENHFASLIGTLEAVQSSAVFFTINSN
jgi:hypothetical protein